MAKRGKTLTVAQMKALKRAGVERPEDWLMVKEQQVSDDGSKSLKKRTDIHHLYIIVNRQSGETQSVEVDV